MYLLHNGHLVPEATFALPLPNRGLQFNDGFFETLIWDDHKVQLLPYHTARMRQAAQALSLQLPTALTTETGLQDMLRALVEAKQLTTARLRLQFWRTGGGLYAPTTAEAEFVVTAQPFQPAESVVNKADFAQRVRTAFSTVSFCKGPNALQYVLAAQERQQRELDELILLDGAGCVAECVSAAIFWVRNGCLYTPSLETGCIAGVRRAYLLQRARELAIPCAEGLYESEALLQAEVVFTANIAGIRILKQVGKVLFSSINHSILDALLA
ncbi:aminotransferase class IV [Hymenobacter jejuensis]|uniref:branched-chain-amino-acid transaminase n=1 Tax=Hymenobacter jejuensis TaxID=2502781 RepID=A0A5B8A5B9_9BACT|nr:aminotransferase class IV [Hymenobacter jejuensis]QDA61896.1 aminotransferase IV [Hymenobacter jejuensis]